MLYVFLMMTIVLEPWDEVRNHYVVSFQLSIHFALCTFTYCFCLCLYHDLMVQVIIVRWCTHVLATLPLMCLSRQMPGLGQQPLDLRGLLLSSHRRHLRCP
jgi:hypothetical protein